MDESVQEYKKRLYRAVELRLRSDVKVGTCLSGGLDSSSLCAIASRLYHQNSSDRFMVIHAKSIEKKTDESFYAKVVAMECGLDLHIVEPSSEDFLKSMDELIYTMEEPYGGASVYMQYFVMQEAKRLGCKVMLDGQGGDETLLGYNRYFVLYLKEVLRQDGFRAFIREANLVKENSSQSLSKILFYLLGISLASLRVAVHKREFSFIKSRYLSLSNYSFLYDISKASSSDKKLQDLEIMRTNLPLLLKVEDKNSMRNSIETRLPFIDYRAVENALSIKSRFKMFGGWSKYILRKSVESILPKSIVWRKKKFAFEAPSDVWIEKMDKSILKESKILNRISDMDTLLERYDSLKSEYRWRLINIAKWESRFDVKII
jgi:asparagine synthase (glutamine-hydrolysing)